MAAAPSASLLYAARLVNFQRAAGVGDVAVGGPAPSLRFVQHPADGAPGAANAVRVEASGVAAVSFELRDGGNAAIGLPTVVVPVDGYADFVFLNPGEGGDSYAVSVSDVDGAALVLSDRFDVRAAAVARSLRFTAQPQAAQEGAPGAVSVEAANVSAVAFRLVDAAGAPVGAAPATVQSAAGSATWGFTVPPTGSGYRVLAAASDDAALRVLSDPFEATPAPADLPDGTFAADGNGFVLTDGAGFLIPA